MMEKEEYIKPETAVYGMSPEEVLDQFKVSPVTGGGGKLAKPYDFEDDEEDMEANKWGTTLPTNVPDMWKRVGE